MLSHSQIQQDIQTPRFFQKRLCQILGGSLLAATVLLFGTNPDQTAYTSYAAEQLPKHLKEANCDELEGTLSIVGLLKLPAKDTCKSVINGADSVGRGAIKKIIPHFTERKNLHVCSIYTTRIFGREVKTLGIGRQFWTFQ